MNLFPFFAPPPQTIYQPPPPIYPPPHYREWRVLEMVGIITILIAIMYYLGTPDNVFSEYIAPESVPEIPFLPPQKKKGSGIVTALIVLGVVVTVVIGIFISMVFYAAFRSARRSDDVKDEIYKLNEDVVEFWEYIQEEFNDNENVYIDDNKFENLLQRYVGLEKYIKEDTDFIEQQKKNLLRILKEEVNFDEINVFFTGQDIRFTYGKVKTD
jgi:flagellar basal body-associated protein FliL